MTKSTEGISRPREATSVATSTFASLCLNRAREPSRLAWLICPLTVTALWPNFLKRRQTLLAARQVIVKMMTSRPAFLSMRYAK